MCQFVPCEVVEVQGQWALVLAQDLRTERSEGVESGLSPNGLNHNHKVYLGLLKDVKIGDYLLVHGDMAINKIDRDEAETVLGLTCA